MMIRLLGLLMLLVSCAASAAPELQRDRTAVIAGEISDNLERVEAALLSWSTDRKPISLVINSPGGSLVNGFWLINKMESLRSSGIRIDCFVVDVAASMAFQLLMHCDRRYTLDHAFLLWHPVRVYVGGLFGEPMTAAGATALANALQPYDNLIVRELKEVMGRDTNADWIQYHFNIETLHVGSTLASQLPNIFRSYPAIPGLLDALNDKKLPRTGRKPSIFGMSQSREIRYIAPDWVTAITASQGE